MRQELAVLSLLLFAGGCNDSAPVTGNAAAVDINAAADQAQGDIDTYESNALQTPIEAAANPPLPPPPKPASTPDASPASFTPPAPGTPGGLADDGSPTSEAPFTPDSAQGAADVVQTYYAFIEEGKYGQAWKLWGDDGKASGMTAAAFAASFATYADYHANIGAPGRIDAGAGQRYVTVPVQVYGRLKAGSAPFSVLGDVTLHRTADIDGATAAQKRWHISTADIKPRAAATDVAPTGDHDSTADGVPSSAEADYRCDGGYAFHVHFDNHAGTATMRAGGKQVVVLAERPAASGMAYSGAGYALRGKGQHADLTRPGASPIACTARNAG